MNRRTYLASAAALTLPAGSGCLGETLGKHPSTGSRKRVTVSDVTTRSPSTPEAVDEDERPRGLAFDVTVHDRSITADATARVELTYTNTGDDTLELNLSPDRPDPQHSMAENPGLVLVSDAYDPERTTEDCWKPRQEAFPVPAVVRQHPIAPGEHAALGYDVWAAPQQDAACIQPGEYVFEPLYGAFTLEVTAQS